MVLTKQYSGKSHSLPRHSFNDLIKVRNFPDTSDILFSSKQGIPQPTDRAGRLEKGAGREAVFLLILQIFFIIL